MGPAAVAQGGEWDLMPRLRVGETYTDNVTLAPERQEEWEAITQLTPGFRIRGKGRRARLDLDYQLQNLLYLREGGRNTSFHQLSADGRTELLRHTLFLDGRASYSQRLIDPEGVVGSNLVPTANRTDVATYQVSPFLRHRFGSFANAGARYSYSRVDYQRGGLDADRHRANASVTSGARFDVVGWALRYRRERESPDNRPDRIFEQASGELSLAVGTRTEVFGVAGYEDNRFDVEARGEEPEGSFWEAGARWEPTTRTFMEAAYGERYFGETWRARLRHRAPHSTWQASYAETLTTVPRLATEEELVAFQDPSGNVITDEEGNPILIEVPFTVQTTEVILRRRASGQVTVGTAKSNLRFRGFRETRELQASGTEQRGYGGGSGWHWRPAARTRSIVSIFWTRHRFAGSDREDDFYRAGWRVTRRIGSGLTASLDYQYLQRDSTRNSAEYRQSSVSLLAEKVF